MLYVYINVNHYNRGGSHASDIIVRHYWESPRHNQACIIMRNAHLFCQINVLLLLLLLILLLLLLTTRLYVSDDDYFFDGSKYDSTMSTQYDQIPRVRNTTWHR